MLDKNQQNYMYHEISKKAYFVNFPNKSFQHFLYVHKFLKTLMNKNYNYHKYQCLLKKVKYSYFNNQIKTFVITKMIISILKMFNCDCKKTNWLSPERLKFWKDKTFHLRIQNNYHLLQNLNNLKTILLTKLFKASNHFLIIRIYEKNYCQISVNRISNYYQKKIKNYFFKQRPWQNYQRKFIKQCLQR